MISESAQVSILVLWLGAQHEEVPSGFCNNRRVCLCVFPGCFKFLSGGKQQESLAHHTFVRNKRCRNVISMADHWKIGFIQSMTHRKTFLCTGALLCSHCGHLMSPWQLQGWWLLSHLEKPLCHQVMDLSRGRKEQQFRAGNCRRR